MTCGAAFGCVVMRRGRAADDKRASCGYTCRGRGGGVSCSDGAQRSRWGAALLRFAAEWTASQRYPRLSGVANAQRQQIRSNKVGVMFGSCYANQKATDAASVPISTAAYPRLYATRWESEARARFSPSGPGKHSSDFLGSRCSLAVVPAATLTSRRNVEYHGSTGAPRARWARPEVGKDPDVTPDQHCEE